MAGTKKRHQHKRQREEAAKEEKEKKEEEEEQEEQEDDEELAQDGISSLRSVLLDALQDPAGTEDVLEGHANYFDRKLALVAPKAYRPAPVNPDAWMKVKARQPKKKQNTASAASAAPKAAHSGPSKKTLRKYDPTTRLTLPELLDRGRLSESPAAAATTTAPVAADKVPFEEHPTEHPTAEQLSQELGFLPGSRAKNPTELKERMAMVRDWFKKQRPGVSKPSGPLKGDSVTNVDLETGLPKSNKRLKKERKAQRKKDAKKQKKASKATAEPGAGAASASAEVATPAVQDGAAAAAVSPADAAADVGFGRFHYGTGKPLPLRVETKKRKSSDVELLKKAQQEREAEREALRTGEGFEAVQDVQWQKMLTKAEGGKVRDDPKLLAKTIKKKTKQKTKSRTEWAEKTKKLEEAQAAKQTDYVERQKKNIARKHFGKRGSFAAPKAGGKGGRAGFEGRKRKLN